MIKGCHKLLENFKNQQDDLDTLKKNHEELQQKLESMVNEETQAKSAQEAETQKKLEEAEKAFSELEKENSKLKQVCNTLKDSATSLAVEAEKNYKHIVEEKSEMSKK